MPWNESGGNNNPQNPWGDKKDQGPPHLDKMLADLIKKLRAFITGKKMSPMMPSSSGPATAWGAGLIGLILLAVWFVSGLFIVNPAEEAVILRFGQYSTIMQPGLHWIARFIDTKNLLDVQKIYSFSLQGDFLTKSSEQGDFPNQLKNTSASIDKSKNLVNVELSVQYRIANPRAYLFAVVNPDQTIEQVATSALSDVVGQMKLDEVLTTGRESLSSGVANRVRSILKNYGNGLEVVAVTLRKVQAPDQVRIAFNDVNRADQDRSTYIQRAQAYASRVVPLAQGDAARISADAEGYRQQIVLTSQANVAKYQALAKVYQESPVVTRERMYLETMQSIFQKTSKILVDVSGGNNMIYLPLEQLLRQNSVASKLPDTTVTSSEPTSAPDTPTAEVSQ
jgi:membrane protease subunit HflK